MIGSELEMSFQNEGRNACLVVALWATHLGMASRQPEMRQLRRVIALFKTAGTLAGEPAQSAKGFLHRQEYLKFIPRHPGRKLDVAVCS